MKFRIFAAALALMMCAVSCGDGGGSGTSSDLGSKPSEVKAPEETNDFGGRYATVFPYDGSWEPMAKGVDVGLEYTISTDFDDLEFDADKFRMSGVFYDNKVIYSGTYTINDGKIIFKYEKCHINESEFECDIDVSQLPAEYDKEVLNRNNSPVDYYAYNNDEKQKMLVTLLYEKMKILNETGTYWNHVAPRLVLSEKAYDFSVFPFFVANVSGTSKRKDSAFMLYPVDDFICVPTYGFELMNKYSHGNDFTVKFNMLHTFLDDPYSLWNLDDWENEKRIGSETTADHYREIITKLIGNTDDTTIEFSDGKWTWINSDGELINNGYYQESDKYNGIIGMYIDDNSKKHEGPYKSAQPLLFYIADDGTIWYPNWVKMD